MSPARPESRPGLRLALLGHPVAHSLSPHLHQAAGAACGLAVRYDLLDVTPAALSATLARLPAEGYRGFNLTAPHKEAALAAMGVLTPAAGAIGAINTVFLTAEGGLGGDNTDAAGFLEALGPLPGPRVVVLGAGGAARAVVWALRQAGAGTIEVLNRDARRAEALVAGLIPRIGGAGDLAGAGARLAGAHLLVNCAASRFDDAAGAAWLAALPLASMAREAVVADLVYRPRLTPLLAAGAAAGLRTVDGLGMLVRQGLLSFERWTGLRPPPDPVEQAVRRAGASPDGSPGVD